MTNETIDLSEHLGRASVVGLPQQNCSVPVWVRVFENRSDDDGYEFCLTRDEAVAFANAILRAAERFG